MKKWALDSGKFLANRWTQQFQRNMEIAFYQNRGMEDFNEAEFYDLAKDTLDWFHINQWGCVFEEGCLSDDALVYTHLISRVAVYGTLEEWIPSSVHWDTLTEIDSALALSGEVANSIYSAVRDVFHERDPLSKISLWKRE